MYRIAHNHLVDHYRRRQPAEPLQQDTFADTQTNVTQALIDDEHRQQLKAGILSLSPDQRDTLLLKLESGLKLEDIARVTGVSRETVKSRLRYAVKKLKQVLIE
jgi:RNA polymerase sigma-70 factor (ECF subfamily)